MKKKNVFAISVLLIFALITLGCENLFDDLFGGKDNNSGGGNTNGTITISGVPSGYSLSSGEVSTFTPNWTRRTIYDNIGATDSPGQNLETYDAWNAGVIGYIYRPDSGAANTGVIQSMKKVNTNGVWESSWGNNGSFNRSGNFSVYLYFSSPSGGTREYPYSFGLDDVRFDNGKVTLDWQDDLMATYGSNGSGGTFPEARGHLTITNIPQQYINNGYYFYLSGSAEGAVLLGMNGAKNVTSNPEYKLIPINGSWVDIPLYTMNSDPTSPSDIFVPYEGDSAITGLTVAIIQDFDGYLSMLSTPNIVAGMTLTSGQFNNGDYSTNWVSVGGGIF